MSLSLKSRLVGNVAVVDLLGRFELFDGEILRDAVRNLMETGTRQFVLNLSELTYINSVGLTELVSAYIKARNRGGDVRLVQPTERVSELLRITKLDTVFQTFADESAAIQSFAKIAARSS